MGLRRIISRIMSWRGETPAMIGVPPSERQISADPTAHAKDFGRRYADPIEYVVIERMRGLGIPEDRIGHEDLDDRGRWRAFFPEEANGGGVLRGKIAADAGLFDVDMMTRKYGLEIGRYWESDRLRDRLDQVIAHEYAEASGISHDEAVQRAAETPLNIREIARTRLRAMAEAERRARGRWSS